MLKKLQLITKFLNKELIFLIIGIVTGILLSGVLRYHYRNECIIKTFAIIATLHDDKDVNLLNMNEYAKNIDTICGKL